MTEQTAEPRSQRIHVTPYLVYDDAPAAIEFLCKAFGFEEKFRYPMPDGRVGHAELSLGGARLFLASTYPEMGFASPKALPGVHCQMACEIDDVDGHFDRAKRGGATISAEPEDEHGGRMYRAVDPEGHRWMFSTSLSESSSES